MNSIEIQYESRYTRHFDNNNNNSNNNNYQLRNNTLITPPVYNCIIF